MGHQLGLHGTCFPPTGNYSGIVSLNPAQVFYAFASTLICWVIWAYKMSFGKQWGKFPLVGTPGPVLTMQQNLAQSELYAAGSTQNFNLSTMIYFQFVFAAITTVILAGALLGRMNFLAWMVFVPLWITFSYAVGAFRFVLDFRHASLLFPVDVRT